MNKRINDKDKVGIVTLYHRNYNFGGLLQAYALPLAINKYFNIAAEQIDYIETRKVKKYVKKNDKDMPIILRIYCSIYKLGVLFFSKVNEKNISEREKAFEIFIEEIPHSKTAYDYKTISKCLEQYATLICGSDQIWNDFGCVENTKVYTLQFVSGNHKKIAYAPSMAILETTESFKDIMREGMKHLDAISIREQRSLPILQSLTDKKIDVVIDPVLLLEKKDWEAKVKRSEIKKKYILCYLLGDNEKQRKAVGKIARKLHLPILTFPHILCNVVRKCDLFFGDIYDYTSGPLEFIGLIKNAEFVITDSFHACVFSMIFETTFFVFERNKIGEKGNMNNRIYDFLEEYHLDSQLVTENELVDMNEIPKVDFFYAHEHWEKRREESLEYLEKALKGTKVE